MIATWLSLINIDVFLSASPPSRASFGIPLYLVDQADGNSLNGARVVSFDGISDAVLANANGYISSATLTALTAAFSQIPSPNRIKVARRDTAANETIAATLLAIRAVDDDWYGIAQDSRDSTDIVALSTAIESLAGGSDGARKLYIAQSSDASLLDASLPAGLAALANRERTAGIYHNSDTVPADLAWLASRLVFDPDTQSAGWQGRVRGITPYNAMTSAQRDLATGNKFNVGLSLSVAPFFVAPGQNMAGRGIHEIISADWYYARTQEDLAFLLVSHADRGEKLTVDPTGQVKVAAVLNTWLLIGSDEDSKHFGQNQTRVVIIPLTSADIQADRMRFKVEAQVLGELRSVNVSVYMTKEPLTPTSAPLAA
jgi:hypothetical protein